MSKEAPSWGKALHIPYTFLCHFILQDEVLTAPGEVGNCQHCPRHSAELQAGQKSIAKPHKQHLHESSQLFKLQRTIFTITALTGTNEKSLHLTFLQLHLIFNWERRSKTRGNRWFCIIIHTAEHSEQERLKKPTLKHRNKCCKAVILTATVMPWSHNL